MKPRSVSRLLTIIIMLRGPGAGSASLYWAIAPHSRDPAEVVEVEHRGLEVVAADVVEVDVERRVLLAAARATGPSL